MRRKGSLLIALLVLALLCPGCQNQNSGYDVVLRSENIRLFMGESKEIPWDIQITPQGRQSEEETAAEKERIVKEIQEGGNINIEISDPRIVRLDGTRIVGMQAGETQVKVKAWYRAEEQPPKGVKARNEVLVSAVIDVAVEE